MSLASLALVLVSLAVVFARHDLDDSAFCNTTCRYDRTIWSLYGYTEQEIPETLWDNAVVWAQFDGDQDWYDNGCNLLNTNLQAVSQSLCLDCYPRYVYLYRQQKRIISNGKKESVTFLDFAYEPSEGNWTSYCSSNVLVVPDYYDEDDDSTFRLRGAEYFYSSGSSCYDRIFCSSTQSETPLETAYNCHPDQYEGWPSLNFCGYDPTSEPSFITYNLGCQNLGCDSIQFQLPVLTKMLAKKENRRKVLMERRKRFDTSCEYADNTWYFNEKF